MMKKHSPQKKEIKEKSHFSFSIVWIFRFYFILMMSGILIFYPGDTIIFKKAAASELEVVAPPTLLPLSEQPFRISHNFLPTVSATGYYVIEKQSGTPLLQKNSQVKFLPASTTKVITALTALDHMSLDEVMTVKRVMSEGQIIGLNVGERYSLENLLYAILVHSANDAAYVVADNYKGGYQAFIKLMNEKAKKLGMVNSNFKNPAGLDDAGQYSTPFDLSVAGRALLKDKTLSKIVSTKKITISDLDFTRFLDLVNVNKLLGEIPGLGGLKTGFTESAGQNLISFYRYQGHEYVIVVIHSTDRFADTKNIIDWIQTNITYGLPALLPSPTITPSPTPTPFPSAVIPSFQKSFFQNP